VPFASGRDVIAQAQSGTGKTATYTTGVLQRIDAEKDRLQALILLPTIPLAQQVDDVVNALSLHMKIKTALCVGGTP